MRWPAADAREADPAGCRIERCRNSIEITGIALALLDILPEYTEEYNRWYDLDHLPEHISKGDVVTARRYAATESLREVAAVQPSEATGGHPPYATIYFFGGPLDFASSEARALWTAKDKTIVRAGRYWRKGTVVSHGYWPRRVPGPLSWCRPRRSLIFRTAA